MDGLKQWKCKHGHVLGLVRRDPVSNQGKIFYATRLMLYRQAVDLETAGELEDVDVIAIIEGTTLDVRCSVIGCGATRTWWMGEAAMERFLETRRIKSNEPPG